MTLPIEENKTFVRPNDVVTHFHLKEGDLVADFGAGSGFFLEPVAKAVGESGRVFACEIQKVLVDKLGELINAKNLANVQPLWCDLEELNGINIPSEELDVALLINTLFMLEDKISAVKEMGRTLRVGGKFFVVDWYESFAGMGPQPEYVVSQDEAVALFENHGFVLEREFPSGDHHYGLAFRKI